MKHPPLVLLGDSGLAPASQAKLSAPVPARPPGRSRPTLHRPDGRCPKGCTCEAEDVRVAEIAFPVPQPPAGRRKLTLATASRRSGPRRHCKVTYRIANSNASNFNLTEFQVWSGNPPPEGGGSRVRIFGDNAHVADKLVSIFEPDTEVIRKGKASKPTEFGKMGKIQEAENQIITSYEVYEKRPSDAALLIPAIEEHEEQLGRVPRLVAGEAAFYSASNEKAALEKGVKRVCIPNRNTTSAERKRAQKKPWFRNRQKWRTGSEGRINVVRRRHGLNRCRYKGPRGMQRWVAFGVIASNLINIGRVLSRRQNPAAPTVD